MRKNKYFLLLCIVFLMLFALNTASFAKLVIPSSEDNIKNAEYIITGLVLDLQNGYNYTQATVKVEEVLKGKLDTSEIVVEGGSYSGIYSGDSHVMNFPTVGSKVFLLLGRSDERIVPINYNCVAVIRDNDWVEVYKGVNVKQTKADEVYTNFLSEERLKSKPAAALLHASLKTVKGIFSHAKDNKLIYIVSGAVVLTILSLLTIALYRKKRKSA